MKFRRRILMLLFTGFAGYGGIASAPADSPAPLSPELAEKWGRMLSELQPAVVAADPFAWEGPLPPAPADGSAWPAAATQPLAWLELLDAAAAGAPDVAVWLLSEGAAAPDLLARLSAKEWARGWAEKTLTGLLGRLPPGLAPPGPALFAQPPIPPQRPRPPLLTKPISQHYRSP